MTIDQVYAMLEVRTGLSRSQKKSLFDTAVLGGFEEIGANISIPKAHHGKTETISASESEIILPSNYKGRMISVKYVYSFDGADYSVPLDPISVTELEKANRGKQGDTTDELKYYAITGMDLRIGPDSVKTGGTIVMVWQRPLTLKDIALIPNAMMLVDVSEANMYKASDERYLVARSAFRNRFKRAESAFQPTVQTYGNRTMPDQVLLDHAYMEEL